MPRESIEVKGVVPATPSRVYQAWLDGIEHGAMTGGAATIEARRAGATFTAWDGYISGRILALDEGRRIVQSWRSTEFPVGEPDSRLEVLLAPAPGGTLLTIRHSEIPEGQGPSYRSGWHEHYLQPMRRYFAARAGETTRPSLGRGAKGSARAAAPRKAARRKAGAPAARGAARRRPSRSRTAGRRGRR
jgi:uncharacterized protein YndB with AHSA1/START domain